MEGHPPRLSSHLLAAIAAPLLVASVLAAGLASAGEIEDADEYDFETGSTSFKLIVAGDPDADPVAADLSLTTDPDDVQQGTHAVEFSYTLDAAQPPAILQTKALLRDLVEITFYMKSDALVPWAVRVEESDGTSYTHRRVLPAGQWAFIRLTPEDFLSPDGLRSPDPSKLDFGIVMLDVRNQMGVAGSNTIHIDSLTVSRGPIALHTGDYIVNGVTESITQPLQIDGDLIVGAGGQLQVTASRFNVRGDVIVANNSVLLLDGGGWQFLSDYPRQYEFDIANNSHLIFKNGLIRLTGKRGGFIRQGSRLRLEDVENGTAGTTWKIREGSTLELVRAAFVGEYVLDENTTTTIEESNLAVLWLGCESTVPVPISPPPGGDVASWSSPAEWLWDVSIENSTEMFWTILPRPGCNVEIKDTAVKAVGMVFSSETPSSRVIRDLEPNLVYEDFCVQSDNSSVCMTNAEVRAWNIYTEKLMTLDIVDSTVGEAISFGDSQLHMTDSFCDASGGHVASWDRSVLTVTRGGIHSELRTYGVSAVSFVDSLLEGDIFAADNSNVTLLNTPHIGETFLFGNATVNE